MQSRFPSLYNRNFPRSEGIQYHRKQIFGMAVSAEICCLSASRQTLRLIWNIITYHFARSLVTNVYKIFKYIYKFSISIRVLVVRVSSCTQTDHLFRQFEYHIMATRGRRRTTREGSNITLRTTPTANIACYREYNLLQGLETIFCGLLVPGGRRADNSEYLS